VDTGRSNGLTWGTSGENGARRTHQDLLVNKNDVLQNLGNDTSGITKLASDEGARIGQCPSVVGKPVKQDVWRPIQNNM